MLWILHLIGWLSFHCLALFLKLCSFIWAIIFLYQHTCYVVGDRALGIHQGGATHPAVLWCCMWGRGQRGNNAACSAFSQLSVTSPTTHKQIWPFWCWFPGGWTCIHSRTLWVSLMNSPVRLELSPSVTTPASFYSQRFWGFISPHYNPGLCDLSHSQLLLPIYLHANVGQPVPPATALLQVLSTQLPSPAFLPSGWMFLL